MSEAQHIVGLSGGKDSTALALWLVENEPRHYRFICNKTGNELPEMDEHWALLERLLGQPLEDVRHTTDLLELCEQMQMLPNWRARWCTRILKIEPTIAFMEDLPKGSTLYVGLRADEEERKGLYGEDMAIRFPLREQGMTLADVKAYLKHRGVTIPKRTDCAWCFYQRIEEWHELWRTRPSVFYTGALLEQRIGHTFRSPGRDSWPASLMELGEAFNAGIKKIRKSPARKDKDGEEICRVCSL